MNENNVFPIRPAAPIFNNELRAQLEKSVAPHTENPVQVVTTVEHAICAYLIDAVRGFFTRLGNKTGDAIVSRIDG